MPHSVFSEFSIIFVAMGISPGHVGAGAIGLTALPSAEFPESLPLARTGCATPAIMLPSKRSPT